MSGVACNCRVLVVAIDVAGCSCSNRCALCAVHMVMKDTEFCLMCVGFFLLSVSTGLARKIRMMFNFCQNNNECK